MSMKKKGCPLLVQSDTYTSLYIPGESSTKTYFLDCLEEKCAAYRGCGAQNGVCDKFGTDIWYEENEGTKK
jgi:hypothetical protein